MKVLVVSAYSTEIFLFTAYAMRSPLASVESCVGWPRVVAGDAANIFSMAIDMALICELLPFRHLFTLERGKWRTLRAFSVA